MFILLKYGPENPAEAWKLQAAKGDDQIVLIQNGVFWAVSEKAALEGKNVAVVKADWLARGYAEEACPFQLVDYTQFVELLEANPKTMS